MKCSEITLIKDVQTVVYHTVDSFSTIKSNRLFIHTTEVNLKIIMISRRREQKEVWE